MQSHSRRSIRDGQDKKPQWTGSLPSPPPREILAMHSKHVYGMLREGGGSDFLVVIQVKEHLSMCIMCPGVSGCLIMLAVRCEWGEGGRGGCDLGGVRGMTQVDGPVWLHGRRGRGGGRRKVQWVG